MIAKVKKNRSSHQAIFFSFILGLFTLMVIGFLIISNWKINQRRSELLSQIEFLKNEIQILEEKNTELQAGILQTQSQEYLEEAAREKFGLKKAGEEVVVVKPLEEEEKTEEEKSLLESWWENLKLKIKELRD